MNREWGEPVLPEPSAEALRIRAATPPYDRLWLRLSQRTGDLVRHTLATGFADTFGSLAWNSCTPMLPEAAMLYLVTDEPSWLDYLAKALDHLDQQSRERQGTGTKSCIHSHAQMAVATHTLRDRLPDAMQERLLAFMRDVAIGDNSGESYRSYGGGNNIAWCHNAQAAICALLWGESCGHPGWREVVQRGIDHTRCYLHYGTDAGGFSYEGTGYGHAVYAIMFPFVELLAQAGIADLYATEPRLRQIPKAFAAHIFPDRSFPINDNDIGLSGAESLPWLLPLARRFDDATLRGLWEAYQGPDHPIRPYGDFRPWLHQRTGIATPAWDPHSAMLHAFLYWDAEAPVIPVEASKLPMTSFSPGTETINLRTSWGRDAIYVNLQGAGRSHASQTHRHADAGHFSIFAHGEYLAIDTGRYNSDEDQHNVMLVDGRCHQPVAPGWGADRLSGRVATYESTPLLTHARIDASHQKGCCWAERDLLWVPIGGDDAYIVLVDNINKDNAAHDFWWQLQAHPEAVISPDGDWQASVHSGPARLDIAFTWPVSDDYPQAPHRFELQQDMKEWHWPYGKGRDIEEAHRREGLLNTSYRRPRLLGKLHGVNGQLLSIIVPRRKDAPPLAIRRCQQRHLLSLEIDTPLGTDTIIAAPDHGFIQTGSIRCLSHLLFMRHDAEGQQLAAWALGGATIEPDPSEESSHAISRPS